MNWQHHCVKVICPKKLDSNFYVIFTGTFCGPFSNPGFHSLSGEHLQNQNLFSMPATQLSLFRDKNKTKPELIFPLVLLTQT